VLAWGGAMLVAASPSDGVADQPEVSVEVTATTPNRLDQPLNEVTGTGSVTVLTRPAIDAQQPLSVPEVLWNVPGSDRGVSRWYYSGRCCATLAASGLYL